LTRARAALVLLMAGTAPAAAQGPDLPALFDVAGVAADDVLNIRAAPDAGAGIVGTLPPDATAVEVVALSQDGGWGRIGQGESGGWVSLDFLARQQIGPWWTLPVPMRCLGTEPFWSLDLNAPLLQATFATPEEAPETMTIVNFWPGEDFRPVAGLRLLQRDGIAVIRAAACSDGMSDRDFGLAIDLFLGPVEGAGVGPALQGCCTLQP
jgi:uncharacterized membrane protein